MKRTHTILISALAVLVIVSIAVVRGVHAGPDSFWSEVAQIAGQTLGVKLSEQIAAPVTISAPNPLGARTYANPTIAETSMTESVAGSATTTLCSFKNTDGANRVITGVDLYFNPDDTAGNGAGTGTWSGTLNFDMSTSTSPSTTSSVATGPLFLPNTTFASSTSPQWFTTSTFTNVNARLWGNGLYLNLVQDQASSSTGACVVKYYNL